MRITFLPPPMEGTLSLGIYDKKGKLVRVLAREATEKDFTIGLNGLITSWDGKDDAGNLMPPGLYSARGYSVGAIEVEGIALHGNDWITDDDAPRPVRVLDLRCRQPGDDTSRSSSGHGPAERVRSNTAKRWASTPNRDRETEQQIGGRGYRHRQRSWDGKVKLTLKSDSGWEELKTPSRPTKRPSTRRWARTDRRVGHR